MEDNSKADALLRQLDFQRQTFADTIQGLQDVLAQGLVSTESISWKEAPKSPTHGPVEPRSPRPSIVSRTTLEKESRTGRKSSAGLVTLQTSSASRATGEDSDDNSDDDDESYYAQDVLPSQHYNHCLLYTSPSPRDGLLSRMPSSA